MVTTCVLLAGALPAHAEFLPGTRVLLDAHNCYPYNGRWADRIDRALSTGVPLAIEQDLVWFRDPVTGRGRSLVAHDERNKPNLGLDGSEPTMRDTSSSAFDRWSNARCWNSDATRGRSSRSTWI
jgi:hypothetical protein